MKTYYSKKHKKRKLILFSILFFSIFFGVVSYFIFIVNPIITESTRSTVLSLSTSAVGDAVYSVLNKKNIKYDDIVNVQYGNESVEHISINTIVVNNLVREMYSEAQTNLDKLGDNGVNISLGTFTGIPALVGVGPNVNIKLVTIGAITAYFYSDFTSAGINQTSHKIYVKFTSTMSLLLPIYNDVVDTNTEFLIAEELIVGKVPDVYVGTGNLTYVPCT